MHGQCRARRHFPVASNGAYGLYKANPSAQSTSTCHLAHYVAAMAVVQTSWYAQNWAEYALRGISQVLDDSMQHWIHCPNKSITS
jgi:hypothetical protein